MNRKQMIDFVNDKVLPDAEISFDDWFYNGKEIFWDIIKAISKWRIGKNINIEMNARVIDGDLFINGEFVKRVASKLPRKSFDERSYYYEGKCLRDFEY